jgi:hypothetical protein
MGILQLIKMISNKTQNQESGENSTNLQGKIVNVYNGITYSDAKEIALDVFNSNYIQLKEEAGRIAQLRAEEITVDFLEKLNDRKPESITEFQQPAMQDALFTVQKEFAKCGDKELGDLLVDILVDRANTPNRNMLQIVLDESLKIAPKLTIEQLDTLTISFLLSLTRRTNIINYDAFQNYINFNICPFAENLTDERTYLNHIEFLGCGYTRAGNYGLLENRWGKTYKALFSNGFTKEEFENEFENIDNYKTLLINCVHNPEKLQINTLDDEVFNETVDELNISDENKLKLKKIFDSSTMNQSQIKDTLIKINPLMEKIINVWTNSQIKSFELTSVGVAIAHANYRRKTNETMDLSIWIK